MADLGGAREDGIRRAGRWDPSVLANYYLTCLPREAIRVLGGHAPTPGSFYIARDIVVPEALLDQIFPQAKVWCAPVPV